MSDAPTPLRLAHFSDLHLTSSRYASWRLEDWLNKRLAAWLNLRVAGRGYRFRHGETVANALVSDLNEQDPHWLLFSGDATVMGFREEVEHAARFLPLAERPGLAVPGNHDYCTRTAMHEAHFEQVFARWQQGLRIGEHTYPFAVRAGEAWLIGLNSATANRWPWDATGLVGREQLARLEELLAQLEGPGPRLLLTHYPIARASGKPDYFVRHLRDLRDVVKVCEAGRISLWLHGHCHDAFHFPSGEVAAFPVICAGSATQTGLWSYGQYEITGRHLSATVRFFDATKQAFQTQRTFELELA
jgi:3',5'-cyclic AMP phosphodiesterase CpdA